jgi:hypothetical protein
MIVVGRGGGLGEDEGLSVVTLFKLCGTTFASPNPNCQGQLLALPPILFAKVAAS